MSVLLLNATYEPIRVLSWQRAVVMILQQEAEVVQVGEGEVRSPSVSLPMPSVIRLLKFVKVPFKTKIPLSRRAIAARDKGICQFTHCNRSGSTIDHVVPRSRGGRHAWENVVWACSSCNHRKADKTLAEIGWSLKAKPVAPRATTWVAIGIQPAPNWEPFLGGTPA